jgi:hypothetical protein
MREDMTEDWGGKPKVKSFILVTNGWAFISRSEDVAMAERRERKRTRRAIKGQKIRGKLHKSSINDRSAIRSSLRALTNPTICCGNLVLYAFAVDTIQSKQPIEPFSEA